MHINMNIIISNLILLLSLFLFQQRYLEQFAANLEGLITHLQDSLNKNTIGMFYVINSFIHLITKCVKLRKL